MDGAEIIAWITAIAGVVAAVAGWGLWRSERDQNRVLRRHQSLLEQQLAETREARAQSKPVDLRMLDLKPTGGGGDYVDFTLQLANYGAGQCRCQLDAKVGARPAQCQPTTIDFVANSGPSLVRVLVPRPELGELMAECNNETTLYGETLVVRARDGASPVEATWREPVYDAESHRERHEIQQRYWRMGRGEETEADLRAEHREERLRRLEEPEEGGHDYDWT